MKDLSVLIIDDSYEDFTYCNHLLGKVFGIDAEHAIQASDGIDLLQSKCYDIVFLDYHMNDMTGMECLQKIRSSSSVKECPVVMMTGQGNEEIAASAIKNGASDYISKDRISLDSLKRVTHNAIEKFKSERVIAEKQRELFFFAHTISHDLRAPLGRIRAYSELLNAVSKKDASPEQIKYLKNVTRDSEYCIEFVDSLLKYAETGRSAIKFKTTNLYKVALRAIKNLELQIKKSNAEVIIENLPEIQGDKIALTQLIQNLIANSIKYCREEPKIKLYAEDVQGHTKLYVVDNGIGMDKKMTKEEVFKPFVRLDNANTEEGVGLGLSLCKAIVDQHGANIEVSSNPTKGSTFCITFPKSS